MEYLILTETEFFGLIDGNNEATNLNAAYNRFVKAVVELMHDGDTDGTKIALAYAENELQFHHMQHIEGVGCHAALFVRKGSVVCAQDAKAYLRQPPASAAALRHHPLQM